MPRARIVLTVLVFVTAGVLVTGYQLSASAGQKADVDIGPFTANYVGMDSDKFAATGLETAVFEPTLIQSLLGIAPNADGELEGPKILMGGGLSWLFRRAPAERQERTGGVPYDFTIRG